MIRVNHSLELFLALYFDVVFNVSKDDLHDAVGVVNLFRGQVGEDAVDECSPLGRVVLLDSISYTTQMYLLIPSHDLLAM